MTRAEDRAEVMSLRARAYLIIAGLRHTALGICCILFPAAFAGPSYDAIKSALPVGPELSLQLWGLLFMGTALLAFVGAVLGREGEARWALLASVITSALWAGGFFAALRSGNLTGPTALVLCLAVTLKDLTMLRAPMRNPFEPLVRKVLADEPTG